MFSMILSSLTKDKDLSKIGILLYIESEGKTILVFDP